MTQEIGTDDIDRLRKDAAVAQCVTEAPARLAAAEAEEARRLRAKRRQAERERAEQRLEEAVQAAREEAATLQAKATTAALALAPVYKSLSVIAHHRAEATKAVHGLNAINYDEAAEAAPGEVSDWGGARALAARTGRDPASELTAHGFPDPFASVQGAEAEEVVRFIHRVLFGEPRPGHYYTAEQRRTPSR